MKKNQGFTLVEVLIVTVVAVLLTLYTIPKITSLLDTSKDKLYEAQVHVLEKAAQDYFVTNIEGLPQTKKDARFLTIDMLAEQHLIESNEVLDPRTNQQMNGCIIVKRNGKDYSYTYNEDCDEVTKNYIPVIKVEDFSKTIEVNEEYIFPKVTATDALGEEVSVKGPYIKNKLITSLDTTNVGKEYTLTYKAIDQVRHITGIKKIKVKVVDTTPPIIKVNGKTKSFIYNQPLDLKQVADFSVKCMDNSGKEITPKVTSTVGHLKGKGTITYLVKDESGNIAVLVVTVNVIDKQDPMILKVDGNRLEYKKESIILSIREEKHLGDSLEYSFDGGKTWEKDSKKEILENGKIQIQMKDMFGNKSAIWEEEVTTIDKLKPTKPTVSLKLDSLYGKEYKNTWTNHDIYLQIESDDKDSFIDYYEYSIDGIHFNKMDSMMSFSKNTNQTYYFRSVDAAGNKSEMTEGISIKIDKQDIGVPTLSLSSTTLTKLTPGKKVWTSGEVSLTNLKTTKKNGSPIAYYEISKDDKYTYAKANSSYLFNKNMKETYYFRSVDEAGNRSEWTKPVYIYIDRVRPSVPQVTLKIKNKKGLTYTSGSTVSDNIYMKATSVDSGSGIDYYQWSTDGLSWENLEKNEKTFKENMNTTVYVRAIDKVGNVSLPYEMKLHIQK